MEITKVLFSKPLENSNVKAYATVTLGDAMAIHGFKVMESKAGEIFLSVPSRKDKKTGKYLNTAHPVNKEFREVLIQTVMEAYQKHIQEA